MTTPGDPTSRFLISNAAISSSGDLHQYIEIDGKRRSHVLDPKTGIGVEGPMMVTVVAPQFPSWKRDAADTTICVLGHESGIALAKKKPDLKVRIVSRDNAAGLRVSQSGFDTPSSHSVNATNTQGLGEKCRDLFYANFYDKLAPFCTRKVKSYPS